RDRRSALVQRYACENVVRRLADQAFDQHHLAHRPCDRFDEPLLDPLAIVEQCHVRRISTCRPGLPVELVAEALMEDVEANDAVISGQDEGSVTKALRAIEGGSEGRHDDVRRALDLALDQFRWRRSDCVADVIERYVKTIGLKGLPGQTVLRTLALCDFSDGICRWGVGHGRPKQAMDRTFEGHNRKSFWARDGALNVPIMFLSVEKSNRYRMASVTLNLLLSAKVSAQAKSSLSSGW